MHSVLRINESNKRFFFALPKGFMLAMGGGAMEQEKNKDIFESLPIAKTVRIMALPTIISQIIVLIYNMADTFYLGRTNDPFMVAGVSLLLPVFNICLSLAGLSGAGGGALISRLLGAGRREEARRVCSFSIYLALCTTACFSLGMFLFMDPLLHLLGASGNTSSYARTYALCVIVLGGVPTVLSNVCANLLRSVGESGKAGFGIAMGGILNIFLDPLFMFLIFPKGQEVLGVGVATLLSNICACTFFLVSIYQLRETTVLTFFPGKLPEKESIGSVFAVGIPSSITTLLFDIDYIVIDKLMSAYGDVALAAVGIVLKVERLPLNVGMGICQGMVPLIAYNYASKNHKRMFQILRFSLGIGLVTAACSIVLYEIFAGGILRVFIGDAETVRLGTNFLRLRILATPLMFCSFFTVFTFQGFGKGRVALFLGVSRWAVLNIPMLFLLNYLVGMYGLVLSQVTADSLNVLLSAIVYFTFKRKHFKAGGSISK